MLRQAVAVSFWLLAAYITAQAIVGLLAGRYPATTVIGIGIGIGIGIVASLLVMPAGRRQPPCRRPPGLRRHRR